MEKIERPVMAEDEFKEYLDNYKVSLDSSRFFESVELNYEILDIQNENRNKKQTKRNQRHCYTI